MALLFFSAIGFVGCVDTMYSMRTTLGTTMMPKGASFASPIEKSSTEAVVYIYRPIGWAQTPDIILNDRNLSALAEGSYFVEKLKPGTVKILVQGNHNRDWSFGPIGVSVNANPGERRYYRIGTGINGILITPIIGGYSREMRIEEVPEDFALQDLSKLRSMR